MLSNKLARKSLLISTLVITIPTIIFLYFIIQDKREDLLIRQETYLAGVADQLNMRMEDCEFHDNVNNAIIHSKNPDDQVAMLNQIYQPILESFASINPDIGFGVFSYGLDRVIAFGPGKSADVSAIHFSAPDFNKIRYSRSFEVHRNYSSTYFNGKPVTLVQYPLLHRGEVLGYVWVEERYEKINAAIMKLISNTGIYVFLLWIMVIMFLNYAFTNLFEAVRCLNKQIKEDSKDREKLTEYPELLTILDTINALRTQLATEYSAKEKLLTELAVINRREMVGEMAASVAHEIRNPLTAVQGFLQLMGQKSDKNFKNT